MSSKGIAWSFLILVALFANSVNALPAYSRLYQAKYGYRPSCKLCHTSGGGSAVTDYGRDFLRAGANMGAYARIEKKDSSGNGFLNLDKIKAKANAGDPRSTPSAPGDWLNASADLFIPSDKLKPLFADAEGFAAIDGTLKDEQVASIQKSLGAPLSDEDKVPTFYFAVKSGKRYAVAQFVAAKSPQGPISVAVAMDVKATITAVRILKNPTSKAIEDSAFLNQFAGKKWQDSLQIGKDLKPAQGAPSDSREVALAVRKAVAIINAVFLKPSAVAPSVHDLMVQNRHFANRL